MNKLTEERLKELKQLWEDLGDIPIDNKDCIELPFKHFEIGTTRFDIWLWVEKEYKISIYDLMHKKENKYGTNPSTK